jgi:hypothetical protein
MLNRREPRVAFGVSTNDDVELEIESMYFTVEGGVGGVFELRALESAEVRRPARDAGDVEAVQDRRSP